MSIVVLYCFVRHSMANCQFGICSMITMRRRRRRRTMRRRTKKKTNDENRVYKKFVRKLIHYGNKKIFYGYTGCIKSSYENFNLNVSPRIFRPFRKANSIKNFLITVMYQFSYE